VVTVIFDNINLDDISEDEQISLFSKVKSVKTTVEDNAFIIEIVLNNNKVINKKLIFSSNITREKMGKNFLVKDHILPAVKEQSLLDGGISL
jgi:hypothetical protein